MLPLIVARGGSGAVNTSRTGACDANGVDHTECASVPPHAVVWEGADNGLQLSAFQAKADRSGATRWPAACDLVDPDETALPHRVYTPPLPIGPNDASRARTHP